MSATEPAVLSNQDVAIKTLVSICESGAPPQRLIAAQTLMNNCVELAVVQQTLRQIAAAGCYESLEAAGMLLSFSKVYPPKE